MSLIFFKIKESFFYDELKVIQRRLAKKGKFIVYYLKHIMNLFFKIILIGAWQSF